MPNPKAMSAEVTEEVEKWLRKHNLHSGVANVIRSVPMFVYDEDTGGEQRITEFSIRLEWLGNKHYLDEKHEQELVEWLRLTFKLFG